MDRHEQRITYLELKLAAVTEQTQNLLKLLIQTVAVVEQLPDAPTPFPITAAEVAKVETALATLNKR